MSRREKADLRDPLKEDRLPPHSPEAEAGVLGCILLAPKDSMVECIERFKGHSNVFYDLRHRTLYEEIAGMYARNELIDTITLAQRLKDSGNLQSVGGLAYVSGLEDQTPSAENLPHYLRIVCEKFQLRSAIATATRIVSSAYEHDGQDIDKFIDEAQASILAVERMQTNVVWEPAALVAKTSHALEHYIKAAGVVEMPTGYACWDRLTGGLHAGEMSLLAGRPSTGKTSLAMCIAERMSIEGRKAVGVLSLEMSAQDLMLRLLCSRARVNFHRLRTGFAQQGDVDKLNVAGLKLRESRIYIDDSPRLSILQVRSKLRQMKQRYDIRLGILDYAQLITKPPGLEDNPVAAMTEISNGLKATAKELNIPLVILCQLNRESEKRGGRPKMSDLRDSGALEQDADFVGILFRKELPEEEEAELRQHIRENPMANTELEVIMEVCKQRNGPTGDIFFNFKRWCMRFEDQQRESKPDAGAEEPL